jgi:hypothetical protein
VRVARAISIEQQTQIRWAARPQDDVLTRLRHWFHDGGLSFEAGASAANGVSLATAMTHMNKADPAFNRVTFPESIDTTNTSDPRYTGGATGYFTLGRVNKVVQQHPASGRKITSWFTLYPYEVTSMGGAAVWKVDGSYHKLYYGPSFGAARTITTLAWESTWLFQ